MAIFLEPASSAAATIETLIQFATKARKNGIVSLERRPPAITDPFLRKAINLAVDGTDLQELRKMMEPDIALGEHIAKRRPRSGKRPADTRPPSGSSGP